MQTYVCMFLEPSNRLLLERAAWWLEDRDGMDPLSQALRTLGILEMCVA